MCNVVSVNHVTGSVDELADMSGEFSDPHSVTCSASSQTPGIISIYVRVLVVSQAVHLVRYILCNASGGIDAVHQLARKRLAMALTS